MRSRLPKPASNPRQILPPQKTFLKSLDNWRQEGHSSATIEQKTFLARHETVEEITSEHSGGETPCSVNADVDRHVAGGDSGSALGVRQHRAPAELVGAGGRRFRGLQAACDRRGPRATADGRLRSAED